MVDLDLDLVVIVTAPDQSMLHCMWWRCTQVDHIIPQWTYTVCPNVCDHFQAVCSAVWSTPRWQGSVLVPILFVLYTADVLQLVKHHRLLPHAYADDILGVCRPFETDELQHRVSESLDAVSLWMAANRLQLNHEKTEALWCSSARRQHQILTTPVLVGCTSVQPVTAARKLGIYLDGDVSMRTHVTTTVRTCFAMLRQIRTVHHPLPPPAMLTMLRSLVINKLDSCSSVMDGALDVLLHRLQLVLNAAIRLVFSARRSDHTTPLLCELHWLKVQER